MVASSWRSAVQLDVLRLAVGLPPVSWRGRTDDVPTFVAGRTPVRAVHSTQVREAIAELYAAADLELPAKFSAGPIVTGTRVIKLSDTLDLRGWVERYELLRPDHSARVVRNSGTYAAPGLDDEHS